jgi:hypothetical protein
MYKTKTGKTLDLRSAKEIAAGGEGKILEHPTDKKKVVKIYHQPRKPEFSKHLEQLSALSKDFLAPDEIYFDTKGNTVGFDMPFVNFNDYWLFNNLFNKGFCNSNGITEDFKVAVLTKLKDILTYLHKTMKIVVGDLNMYNLFVSKKGDILFADVDSYQTSTQPHSGVLLDEIRDWTTLSINEQTDSWAYDILAFWATTFCHPYKWVVPGNKESLEQRVKANKSILTNIQGIKIPPLYQPPTGETLKQFKEIFSGRRYMVDFIGTHVPVNVQVKQQVQSTSLEIREILQNVTHVNTFISDIAVRQSNGTWSLIETAFPKVTRIKETNDKCDEMYPFSNTYRTGDYLYTQKGHLSFGKPIFYYNNGSLAVFDYGNDTQWNINLANQQFGIDYTSTQVFMKSIIVRDAPIQNFGAQKYLNIPYDNKYKLLLTEEGIQNAIYLNNHVAYESKKKSKITYSIHNTISGLWIIYLDYLPFFTVKNNLIFVPENGFIDIYKDGTVISKLDCSMCTRDSKLYSTNAGIILLENNTLYLLNTKQ